MKEDSPLVMKLSYQELAAEQYFESQKKKGESLESERITLKM